MTGLDTPFRVTADRVSVDHMWTESSSVSATAEAEPEDDDSRTYPSPVPRVREFATPQPGPQDGELSQYESRPSEESPGPFRPRPSPFNLGGHAGVMAATIYGPVLSSGYSVFGPQPALFGPFHRRRQPRRRHF